MSAVSFSLSAVLAAGSRRFLKDITTILPRCTPFSTTPSTPQPNAPSDKIMSWQESKQKYLSMTIQDKRKEYKCNNYHTLQDIPTWPEYVKASEGKLAKKIDVLPGVQIDESLNEILAQKVSMFLGDITTLEVDAIVNAANKSLRGGGGVDGAIHRSAGPLLLSENVTLGGCNVGEAKITGGYKLPAKYVIATVGPHGEKPDFLKQCYKNSMDLLLSENLKTVAFPCISTGIYGYPLVPAAHVAVGQVRSQLERNVDKIDRVIFCLFSEEDEQVYQGVMQSYFPTK